MVYRAFPKFLIVSNFSFYCLLLKERSALCWFLLLWFFCICCIARRSKHYQLCPLKAQLLILCLPSSEHHCFFFLWNYRSYDYFVVMLYISLPDLQCFYSEHEVFKKKKNKNPTKHKQTNTTAKTVAQTKPKYQSNQPNKNTNTPKKTAQEKTRIKPPKTSGNKRHVFKSKYLCEVASNYVLDILTHH